MFSVLSCSKASFFQLLEGEIRLFTQERNNGISVFISAHMGTQLFRSIFVSSIRAIFPATAASKHMEFLPFWVGSSIFTGSVPIRNSSACFRNFLVLYCLFRQKYFIYASSYYTGWFKSSPLWISSWWYCQIRYWKVDMDMFNYILKFFEMKSVTLSWMFERCSL